MFGDTEYSLINFSGTYNRVQLQYGAAGIAPHAFTVRATYTVPANRVALVQMGRVLAIRDLAAGVAGLAQVGSQVIPNGLITETVLSARIINVALGSLDKDRLSAVLFLKAGDTINIFTSDASTGGTVAYSGACDIIEFSPNGNP